MLKSCKSVIDKLIILKRSLKTSATELDKAIRIIRFNKKKLKNI